MNAHQTESYMMPNVLPGELSLPEPRPDPFPEGSQLGYVRIDVLPQLIGCKWDNISRAMLEATRPSCIQVMRKGIKQDANSVWWRVTVHLDENSVIERVEQECKVPLPFGVSCGKMMKLAILGA